MSNVIIVAENLIVDVFHRLKNYPVKKLLTSISSVSNFIVGVICNYGIDRVKFDSSFQLTASSAVGNDDFSQIILKS